MANRKYAVSFDDSEVKCSRCEATTIATVAIVSVDEFVCVVDFPPHQWRGPIGARAPFTNPIYTCRSCYEGDHGD